MFAQNSFHRPANALILEEIPFLISNRLRVSYLGY